ncbi:MAG: porin family protein [candidate division Zixibacteria bacterium]|nr:porin family protein [candidate division Zixibacteria bacterium]
MKKVLIVLVSLFFLVLSSNLFAQMKTEKGRIELGGSAGFYTSSVSYDGEHQFSETEFSFYPRMGFFIIDKFEIEPQLVFKTYSFNPEGGESGTVSHFGGIFSLSYNFEGNGSMVPFVFAGIGVLTNSITDEEDIKASLILPEVGVGLKAFFNNNWAFRSEAFFNHMTNGGRLGFGYTGLEDLKNNTFGFRLGFSVFPK